MLLKRALAASLFVHVALAVWFWFKKTAAPPSDYKIEFEIKETAAIPKGDPNSHGHRRSGKFSTPKIGSGLKWENLRITGTAAKAGEGHFKDEGNLGLEEYEWGSHGGKFEEVANYGRMNRLFIDIQGLLYYPPRLGIRGLGDAVNSRLYFGENSQCDWKRTHIGGSHPYFRMYTLALFKKLCGMTKNMADMHFKAGEFADVGFNFEVIGSVQYQPDEKRDSIVGNVLLFNRTFFRPKTQIDLGPFTTDPVFGQIIAINIPWIQEHWEKWVEGRDPLREFREP